MQQEQHFCLPCGTKIVLSPQERKTSTHSRFADTPQLHRKHLLPFRATSTAKSVGKAVDVGRFGSRCRKAAARAQK